VVNDVISLVDLPGYGFAKVPRQQARGFLPMLQTYIATRENLLAAFVLMDIRRLPEDFEHAIISALQEKKIPVAITLTKCDKLARGQREKQLRLIGEKLGVGRDSMFVTSSKTGEGKRDLLGVISDAAASPGRAPTAGSSDT
jgi:GTP-binding protein